MPVKNGGHWIFHVFVSLFVLLTFHDFPYLKRALPKDRCTECVITKDRLTKGYHLPMLQEIMENIENHVWLVVKKPS
jgi:hypothetical protein